MINNELGSSRMDTVLKMLLIAFVSLLAFSSGVYFGKQMSDSDHQLKALESDFSSQTYTAGNDEATEGSDEQIEEEEVASLSDKYLNEEKEGARNVASAHGEAAHGEADAHAAPAAHAPAAAHNDHAAPAAHAPATAHGKEAEHGDAHAAPAATHGATHGAKAHSAKAANAKVDLSAAHAAAQRVANNAAPTAPVKAPAKVESRTPTSLPKTVGAKSVVEFTVQVASYPTTDAAKERANELVKKGFPAFPVEATVNGKTWYRVSVGSFKTMKDATTYRAQLLKQADLQSAIVQRITR